MFDEFEFRPVSQMGQVLAMTGDQIVERDNFVPGIEKTLAKM